MCPSSTSSSSAPEWAESQIAENPREDLRGALRFAAKVALFALPLLLIAGFFETVLFRLGENWPAAWVRRAQRLETRDSLHERAYFSQQFNVSKWDAIVERSPEVLALGSSRAFEFRAEMFAPRSFYTGGGMIQNIDDLVFAAHALSRGDLPRPKLLIVTIDPWFLSRGAGRTTWLDRREDTAWSFSEHVNVARALLHERHFPWKDAILGRRTEAPGTGYRGFGWGALATGDGDRASDGSHQYTADILGYLRAPVYRDRESPPIIDRLRAGKRQFSPSAGLDPALVELALGALREIRDSGIETCVVLPPFSSEVWNTLGESTALREWWREYREDFPAMVRALGIRTTGPSSPFLDGLDDRYMFDGWHPGEVYLALIVENLVRQAPADTVLGSLNAAHLAQLRAESPIPLAFRSTMDSLKPPR